LKIIDVYTCYLLGLPGHGEAIVDREC
jgi:hypothetical protein